MRQLKKTSATPPVAEANQSWQIALWLVILGGTMFFWPACLDRYLAPRFLFLSLALILSFLMLRKDIQEHGLWHFGIFDWLLLGWYGFNLISVTWAFSWSEGVFYAQKTLLLFLVYGFIRQAFQRNELLLRQNLRQIITVITWAVCGIMFAQVGLAFSQQGLNNENLYGYVSGLSGNKSLAADFLFFLLVLNVLFYKAQTRRSDFWLAAGMIGLLILLLQTRTVYLALGISGIFYCISRAFLEAGFRKLFLKKCLPAGMLAIGLLLVFISWKGRGNSFSERLNPMTYLQSETANERRFVWYKTDLLNREHFWLGVGDGSWKFWFPSKNIDGAYRMEEKNVVFTRAHNDYLEIRAEMGIVGILWFCALFGLAFIAAIRALYRSRSTLSDSTHDLLVCASGLAGYCVIQFFDFPRERIELQVILGILFAWTIHASDKDSLNKSGNQIMLNPLISVLAMLGLTFNLLLGWNRVIGEIHNVRVFEAQAKSDWKALAAESAAAENSFYRYTDVAIPLAWHEGIAYYQTGQIEKALDCFKNAYQLNPWSFQVINNYASALVKHQQFREAIPLYEQALNINPSYDDGKLNLCFAYLQLGENSKSMEWLERVDTIANPGNEGDREKNRQVKIRQSQFRKALEDKMK